MSSVPLACVGRMALVSAGYPSAGWHCGPFLSDCRLRRCDSHVPVADTVYWSAPAVSNFHALAAGTSTETQSVNIIILFNNTSFIQSGGISPQISWAPLWQQCKGHLKSLAARLSSPTTWATPQTESSHRETSARDATSPQSFQMSNIELWMCHFTPLLGKKWVKKFIVLKNKLLQIIFINLIKAAIKVK